MKRLINKRAGIALILALVMVSAACPAQSQLDKAAKASNELSHYTGDAIAVTRSLFESGLITLEKKDQIAGQLVQLSRAGQSFNELLVKLNAQYPSGSVDPTAWALLSQNFDAISKAFVQLLDSIAGANAQLGASKAMRIIRAAVLTLAVLLQAQGVNSREIERWTT